MENPAKRYGSAQVINEVGRTHREEISREAYLRDLEYAKGLCLDVHQWTGEDLDGQPMVVSWVTTTSGRLLAAYEIQGRA